MLRSMKRLSCVLVLVALICSVGFAEETKSADFNSKFISGGFWISEEGKCGGGGEWGFAIVENPNGFFMRDCFTGAGYGGNLKGGKFSFGEMTVGNKFMMGGSYDLGNSIVRTYGIFGVDFGVFSINGHKFYECPFLIEIPFGGGFEFQYSKKSAFVVEFGGKYSIMIGENAKDFADLANTCPKLSIGYRSFR